MKQRAREWWRRATFGAPHPARRVATLAGLGLVSGVGEAAVVVLVVALASESDSHDVVLLDELPAEPWVLAALALGSLLLLAAAHFGSARIAAHAATDVERTVQTQVITAFLKAPWPAQARTRRGELQNLAMVRTMLLAHGTQEAATAVAALLNLAVLVIAAAALSPWATLGLLGAVAASLLVAQLFRARRTRGVRESMATSAALATDVSEVGAAARDVRVFGVRDAAVGRLRRRIDETADRNAAVRVTFNAMAPLTRDVTVALLVVAVFIIVTTADVSLAVLGATVLLLLRSLAHGQSIAMLTLRLEERGERVADIERHLAAWRPEPTGARRPCPMVDRIELDDVRYRYPGAAAPALDGVSLTLTRGEVIGVVGPTGAGKSTLAALLLGLVRPDSGSVRVGGIELGTIDPTQWHSRTAWVGQEPHLLDGTVGENIVFMRSHVDRRALGEAARAAALERELEEWPLGFDHPVGPGGSALSGGQRQRVALARALAGSPSLLVLDEPTSALDAQAELAVLKAISAVRQDAIVMVIAHRASTIEVCDRFVVLEDGRLTAVRQPEPDYPASRF